MAQHELDVTGLSCPFPVLKAAKAIKQLAPGDELIVLATDPASIDDMKEFCVAGGFELVSQEQNDNLICHHIKR